MELASASPDVWAMLQRRGSRVRGPVNLVQNIQKRLQAFAENHLYRSHRMLDFVLRAATALAYLYQPLL
jgi:hypothetical protein